MTESPTPQPNRARLALDRSVGGNEPRTSVRADSSPRLSRLDDLVRRRPEIPYVLPFMAYLLLLSLESLVSDPYYKLHLYTLRSVGGLATALLFWRYYPPFGKLHPLKCVVVGLLVAFGWVLGHRYFAGQFLDGAWVQPGLDWYAQPLGGDARPEDYFDPAKVYGTGLLYWLYLIVRIGGASITVPIVEELFWRAFLLRALIDWDDFDKVKLGAFTIQSFLICSLLSAVEHPQWEVGIACWMVYNLLFYWTRSLLCLIVTHAITNFALYTHIVVHKDWVFWS